MGRGEGRWGCRARRNPLSNRPSNRIDPEATEMFRDRNNHGGEQRRPHSSNSGRKTSWAGYVFVLGGLGIAAAATAAALILDTSLQFTKPLWIAGITWAAVAQTAHVLWLGLRHGDWSAFGRYEFPDNAELVDWTTGSGSYAWMRIAEEHERLMREDCHLRNHDHGSLPS